MYIIEGLMFVSLESWEKERKMLVQKNKYEEIIAGNFPDVVKT